MDTTTVAQPAPPTTRKETRADRGLALYRERGHEIEHTGHGVYSVPGCSGGTYTVDLAPFGGEESCSCPDPAPVCKHIFCATIYRAKTRARARKEQAGRTASRASRGNVASLAASL